jgi:hypothetical protein
MWHRRWRWPTGPGSRPDWHGIRSPSGRKPSPGTSSMPGRPWPDWAPRNRGSPKRRRPSAGRLSRSGRVEPDRRIASGAEVAPGLLRHSDRGADLDALRRRGQRRAGHPARRRRHRLRRAGHPAHPRGRRPAGDRQLPRILTVLSHRLPPPLQAAHRSGCLPLPYNGKESSRAIA